MKNRSKTLIISMILGVAYSIFLMSYFYDVTMNGNGMDFIAGSIASAMVAFIMYYVASLLFIMYAIFTLPIAIIATIGYVRMKKYIC